MKSYRDLIVWQKSVKMVTLVYTVLKFFPNDERFSLVSQIKRSAVSIPSNIAEGYGRNYTKDYSRFLQISRGSLYEMQTQLEIAINLEFINVNQLEEIKSLSIEVEKMLNTLIKKLSQ
ncbi:four helix bundle protein [Winogradskyella sp. PC-19]|uniref:four helix bundle protein n=1 Tax=unclassified Winogradskyella TaxID=2615021 RepID=UPI000B3BE664|nr:MULTISPECIES: four helix bundle protein [unclassified Winogradskyella]ARV08810.1 four helix bundle protein [Winogradskyella sp. PC-19]RZN76849.1 MAG: four helix bundle protein [Winogradskyella sp.]